MGALNEKLRKQDGEKQHILPSKSGSYGDTAPPTDTEINPRKDVTGGLDSEGSFTKKEDDLDSSSIKQRMVGMIMACLAGIACALSLASAQALDQSVPHAQLNAFRFLALPLLGFPMLIRQRCQLKVARASIKWIFLLAVMHMITNYTLYGASYYLPVGTVAATAKGTLLVLLAMVTCTVYKKFSISMIISVSLAVLGIILVIQPQFLFPAVNENVLPADGGSCFTVCDGSALPTKEVYGLSTNSTHTWIKEGNKTENKSIVAEQEENIYGNLYFLIESLSADGKALLGYVMVLLFAVVSCAKCFSVNRNAEDIGVAVYTLWMPIMASILSVILMFTTETPRLPSCWFCCLTMVFHALFAAINSLLVYPAVKLVSPLTAETIMSSATILMDFILQYTLLTGLSPGHGNWLEYVGAVLVVLGVVIGPLWQFFAAYRITKQKTNQEDLELLSKQE